ncbi:hypothetical protein GCM10029964_035520 [Kibdelosporangium lantanae]
MTLSTEYPFVLPKGFVDEDGEVHRNGVMRLACARDEIEPLRDPGSRTTRRTRRSSCSPGS